MQQLTVGAEMEAYGIQVAANFAANLGRSQEGNPAIANVEWYNKSLNIQQDSTYTDSVLIFNVAGRSKS